VLLGAASPLVLDGAIGASGCTVVTVPSATGVVVVVVGSALAGSPARLLVGAPSVSAPSTGSRMQRSSDRLVIASFVAE
jgi:hypothetical protein